MDNNMKEVRGRASLATLAGIFLVSCLPGCASVHGSDESTDGGFLHKALHVTEVAAIEIASPFKIGTVRNAWQDGSGMWHWTKVEQGVGTFKCDGRELGTPQQCEQISPQW